MVKLTPDDTGSYVNGKWSQLASLPRDMPLRHVVAVLADGRLIIEAGIQLQQLHAHQPRAIYDPTTNVWTPVPAPTAGTISGIRRRSCCQRRLRDRKQTYKTDATTQPKTMKWSSLSSKGKAISTPRKLDPVGGWLDPYGGREDAPNSEIYTHPNTSGRLRQHDRRFALPSPDGCINYGPGGKLCYYPPGEIGPQILRPDGTVFVTDRTRQATP